MSVPSLPASVVSSEVMFVIIMVLMAEFASEQFTLAAVSNWVGYGHNFCYETREFVFFFICETNNITVVKHKQHCFA